jgi:hypothetical protein
VPKETEGILLKSSHRPWRTTAARRARHALVASAAIAAFATAPGTASPAAKAAQPHWTGQITVTYHESGSGSNATTGGDIQAVYLVQGDQIVDLSQWVAYRSAQALGYCGTAQRVVSGLGAQHLTKNAGSVGLTWSDAATFALALPSLTASSTQHIQLVKNNRACSPTKATDKDAFAVPLPDLSALHGNSKLPDLSGSTTKTCTGCTLQLGKPGFAATGNWTSTVSWDLVSISAMKASRKATVRRYAIGLRTQCAELTGLSATLAKGTGAAPAVAPALATLAGECLYDSTQAFAIASDPADPHYKHLAKASAPVVAPVAASGPLTDNAARLLTVYMTSWAKEIGVENALVLSLNRMTGARNAKSAKFVQVQLKVARQFALQLAAAIRKREAAASAVATALHDAGIQGLAADPNDLDALRAQALAGTLPQPLADALKALNAPAAATPNAQMALALLNSGRLKTLPAFPALLTDSTTLAPMDSLRAQLKRFGTPPRPHHHSKHHKHKP